MPFRKNGFFGTDAFHFQTKNLKTNARFFETANDLNLTAHSLMEKIIANTGNIQEVVGAALYVRGIQAFSSTMILMKYGLQADAMSCSRTLFESAICLRKASKNKAWVADEYVPGLGHDRKKILEAVLTRSHEKKTKLKEFGRTKGNPEFAPDVQSSRT